LQHLKKKKALLTDFTTSSRAKNKFSDQIAEKLALIVIFQTNVELSKLANVDARYTHAIWNEVVG
jgi:hypothetical protein